MLFSDDEELRVSPPPVSKVILCINNSEGKVDHKDTSLLGHNYLVCVA